MKLSKSLALLLIIALVIAMVPAVLAQETGSGGPVIETNLGDDPSTFNPVIGNDNSSSQVYAKMYPDIIALDPVTLEEVPNVPQGLATGWEYDETGTELTVFLREDAFWSDGEQITADDYLWVFNAVKSGTTSSPRTYVFNELDDGTKAGGTIFSAEKIDDFTIKFVLGELGENEDGSTTIVPNCIAISDINDIAVVPSHIYEAEFGSDYALMDEDPYFVPAGTFGPFTDPFFESGVSTSLVASSSYPDAELGYVVPSEWIYVNVENQTVAYEKFLAGESTYESIAAPNQNEFRATAAEKGFQITEYPSNGYTYMGYNLADPNNPLPGLDENGDYVDQGMHPIFGDVRVRQAFAHAVDVNAIIGTGPDGDNPATGILEGNGAPAVVHNHPESWVDPGLEPYTFDMELAASMLEEAGWVDADGDGIRECQGCLYSTEVDATYEGTPMSFELLTNAGNEVRERTGTTIKSQLAELGVDVQFQAIDFGTLVDELVGQQFDAIIIGWNLGLPFDPDGSGFFGAADDVPGSGFAMTSYQNPELEALWTQAVSYPGCDREARMPLYQEAMKILYEDQPYMWLFYGNVMVAAQPNVENFDPLPYAAAWNMDAWTIDN
ncbi:peptide-binding protein [Anaerolineales bacterium]